MCEPQAAAKLLVKDEYKMLTAMMPCTIAVYVKSDGKTYISMMNLKAMGEMYGGDVLEMTKELAPQMERNAQARLIADVVRDRPGHLAARSVTYG